MYKYMTRRNIGLIVSVMLLVAIAAISFGTRPSTQTTTGNAAAGAHRAALPNGNQSGSGSAAAGTGVKNDPHAIRVVLEDKHDTSPPLRDMPAAPGQSSGNKIEHEKGLHGDQPLQGRTSSTFNDPVLQKAFGILAMPTPIITFEGVGVSDSVPPDTQGDVGPNHYVQWINTQFAVYNKSGTRLLGPRTGNSLWQGFGGPCETTNDGDPITLYDQLADRWLMSQFGNAFSPNGPYYQCIAISQTADPTGAWHRYQFTISPNKLNDYPHFGVWPDAYYMTANLFIAPNFDWGGDGQYAFDRAHMLLGETATVQIHELGVEDWGGMLPSDLDGSTLPPSGAPNTFVEITADEWSFPPYVYNDEMQIWQFHVDWSNPSNSTFTGPVIRPVAAFDGIPCPSQYGTCVQQPGTSQRLDTLFDRVMYRLAYRNFGDHESLVFNHSVDANGANNGYMGVRWYEVRSPRNNPVIYQQSTYAPDSTSRWMGSSALDRDGNMAIGFSASDATSTYPGIRYAGRLVSDPLNELTQGEATLQASNGSQTGVSRWGDYSMLSVDPTDDCTFWFTNEYYPVNSTSAFHTRIGSFKFPNCGTGPTPTPSATNTPVPPTATNTPVGATPTNTPEVTATATPCTMTFTDVPPGDPFYTFIRYLYCGGVISGYGDNTFRPGNPTTRGQLTKIVVLAVGWDVQCPATPHFTDVPTTHTFYCFIETAFAHGIISGYSGNVFLPGNDVTRGQLSKIVVSAMGWAVDCPANPHFSDVPTNNPFYCFVETAYAHGIISGYSGGVFRPGNSATRGQISKIVYLAVTNP